MALVARLRFGARQSARQPSYDLGGDVTVWAEFRDSETNALTAAAGVAFALTKADGTVLSPAPTVITEAAGVYRCVLTPSQAGLWAIEVSSTTSGATNDRREFLMVSDTLAPAVIGPTAVTSVNGQVGPAVTIDFDASLEVSRGEASGFAFVTDGATDNAAVWADFVDYCITNNLMGVLPKGDIYISTSPGTTDGADQINTPAIRDAANPLRIRGAGEGLTILKASVASRNAGLVALTSGPILRMVGGVALELSDLTIDGGVSDVPSVASGMRALTLSSPASDTIARDVNTIIETDGVPLVRLRRVTLRRYYLHRDNTAWAADPAAFRSRRTGGICIHRASLVEVEGFTLGPIAAREGLYLANCQHARVRGFTFDGIAAEQDARGSHALSTALNIFGPETAIIDVADYRIVNNAGSAANLGGADIRMSGGYVAGDIDDIYGDGLDFGTEHQIAAFGETHPPFRRLVLTDTIFRGCSRYALRAYHEPTLRAGDVILDNLIFDRCYQGPEFEACDRVSLGNIIVRDAFYRADYDVSGRGVYLSDCAVVAWNNLTIDASGGDGAADYMRHGLYIDKCQKVVGGTAIINEAKESHVAIYQASGDPDLDSADINLGTIHAFQTQTRDGTTFAPITIGRTSGRVARFSATAINYNGLPAVLTAGALRLNTDTPPVGLQRIVLGSPSEAANFADVMAQIDLVNGDGSGSLSDRIRAAIVARVGANNGRGASVDIETASYNDARRRAVRVTQHGSLIIYPEVVTVTPRCRHRGEFWIDSSGIARLCTTSGRTSATTALPGGLTCTADGSTSITLSASQASITQGDLITVGGAVREVQRVSGAVLTLDQTVSSGTGIAVANPLAATAIITVVAE